MSQAYLWKSRKQLNILVGALKAQHPIVSLSPFALQANEIVEAEEMDGVAKESSNVPANASPLVLQFFQVCASLCISARLIAFDSGLLKSTCRTDLAREACIGAYGRQVCSKLRFADSDIDSCGGLADG